MRVRACSRAERGEREGGKGRPPEHGRARGRERAMLSPRSEEGSVNILPSPRPLCPFGGLRQVMSVGLVGGGGRRGEGEGGGGGGGIGDTPPMVGGSGEGSKAKLGEGWGARSKGGGGSRQRGKGEVGVA